MAVLKRMISFPQSKECRVKPKEKDDVDEDLFETHIKCCTENKVLS